MKIKTLLTAAAIGTFGFSNAASAETVSMEIPAGSYNIHASFSGDVQLRLKGTIANFATFGLDSITCERNHIIDIRGDNQNILVATLMTALSKGSDIFVLASDENADPNNNCGLFQIETRD